MRDLVGICTKVEMVDVAIFGLTVCSRVSCCSYTIRYEQISPSVARSNCRRHCSSAPNKGPSRFQVQVPTLRMQAPLREEIAEFYDSLDPESLEQVIDDLGVEVRAAMALKRFRKQAKERAKARMQLNAAASWGKVRALAASLNRLSSSLQAKKLHQRKQQEAVNRMVLRETLAAWYQVTKYPTLSDLSMLPQVVLHMQKAKKVLQVGHPPPPPHSSKTVSMRDSGHFRPLYLHKSKK